MIARLAVYTAVAAECLIIYTLAELFAAGYDLHPRAIPALSWLFLGFVAFALPQLMAHFGLNGVTRVLISLAVAYVAVVGVFRIEFAGDLALWDLEWVRTFIRNTDQASRDSGAVFMSLLLVIILWARCSYRAAQELDLEGLPRAVAPGFAIVTILVVLGAMTDRTGEVGRAAAAFYAVGILALAFSQLALSGATIGEVRAGGLAGALMGGILGVTVIGAVLFTVVFGLVWPAVSPIIFDTVATFFTVILTPPAWALEKIFNFVFSLMGTNEIQIQPADLDQSIGALPEEEEETTAEKVGGTAIRTSALLVVLGIGALAVVIFSAFRKRGQKPPLAGPSRAAAGGSLGEDLRGLFRNMFRRNPPSDHGIPESPVGRLYADVLHRAENAGRPRQPAETPIEFAPVAAERLHTGNITDEITRAFVQARYAGRDPDATEISRLEREWQSARDRENGRH